MKIASLKKVPRRVGLWRAEFDGETPALELSEETVLAEGLFSGMEVDHNHLATVVRSDQMRRCRTRAWDRLSRRPHSRAEMKRVLRTARFPADVVEEVLDRIAGMGYIDDTAYAKQVVEARVQGAREGPLLVRQKLAQRGVSREVIDEVMAPAEDPVHQAESARALLEKWNKRSEPSDPHKRRQAAAAYLARRGFDSEIVWEAVREMQVKE
jgi:regulatory protein